MPSRSKASRLWQFVPGEFCVRPDGLGSDDTDSTCTSIVSTPIWTTGTPGSGERFGINDDLAITPETAAEAIHDVVESAEYPGGTILEVSRDGTRVIPEWLIQPPGMVDGKMPKGTDVPPEMIAQAMKPILDRTAAERGKLN